MRYCRFLRNGQTHYGRIEGDAVVPLSDAPWTSPREAGPSVPLASVELLVPTAASKVVCVGQNYRKHAQEMGKPVPEEPLLFLKPSTALNAHGRPIRLPPASQDVQHESELGLVIGRTLTRASEQEAAEGIFALTCVNDVTARDIQRREVQHTRAKSYDTFACAGPWMVTGLDPR
ncbi:MAG: fumarylacetoacetate hydrolase family protein, partial [Myxococcaceae bacterium]|nr:fumarylacetoacetate hydrolase family protein [Myxococcaceae bacterium]